MLIPCMQTCSSQNIKSSARACSSHQLQRRLLDCRTTKVVALEVTLGWTRRWGRVDADGSDGTVGLEHAVVDEPCSGVELGEEGLDAEAVLVVGGGNSLENGKTDDGLQ